MSLCRLGLARAFAAALAGCGATPQPAVSQQQQQPQLRTAPSGLALAPLEIRSGSKSFPFTVEIASTEDEQAQGLMFRQSLAPDRGMIFPHDPPREASFWMKNTLIPLDMVFIRPDGTIARIEANTVPLSLDPVSSGEPVGAVLELAGGRAGELGIAANDRVDWPH